MNSNERINSILHHRDYIRNVRLIEEYEKNREFCRHDLNHFLDVCRIAYIINLEENLNYPKDIIYAIGLLHDIGRVLEYEKGTPHNKASIEIGVPILEDCKFNVDEINTICSAIDSHRVHKDDKTSLEDIMYRSDKLSRSCFNCKAIDKCYWSEEKKNKNIMY